VRIVPYTPNRELIYDLLTRARRFHCSVSGSWEFDVTALEAARRAVRVNGRVLSTTACLLKATGLVLERYPRLNHHLFHGLFRKFEVEFDTINCTLVLQRRGPDRERLLFPVTLERTNERTVEELQAQIDHHRYAPLAELPQVAALERLKRLPRFVLSWFSWKARSDPAFYLRYFGTYGLSNLSTRRSGPVGGSSLANTGAAFLLGPVRKTPQVVGDAVVVRPTLGVMLVADHFLVDGADMLEAMAWLGRLLADPTRLGLPAVTKPVAGAAPAPDEDEEEP
jgi:pyruvate/2-oxoglutarate dehydrogenase complex dihydrolipoamide acyltransferase (E2) component